MPELVGTPEQKLARVQEIVENYLPELVCELQDYKTQIGCGALDDKGTLRQIKWRLRGLTEYHVEDGARSLATHFAPRMTLHRSGGAWPR